MKIEEIRQMKKNEALNKIRKMFSKNPKDKFKCDQYDPSSYGEQRDYEIEGIIEELNKELEELKVKK